MCGLFGLKTTIMNNFVFRETLCPVPLDLCILLKFIFLYLRYIPPHSCAFHTFCLHQFLNMYFSPDDAVDRRKLGIYFQF